MRSSGGVNAEIAEPMPFIRKLAVATVRAEADRFDDNVVPSAGAPTYQEVADALNAARRSPPGQALVAASVCNVLARSTGSITPAGRFRPQAGIGASPSFGSRST